MTEAGEIEALDGIYKNAFNLILGAQGRGKTYHAEELLRANAGHFEKVLRFAPGGSCGGGADGDVSALITYLNDREQDAERQKVDAKRVDILRSAIIQENPKFAFERGITRECINDLLKRYPSHNDVGKIPPHLVLIDDMGGDPVLKDQRSIFNRVARRLRHLQLTIVFNGHQYKDLSPFVRNNTQIVYLHGGLPVIDFKHICSERRIPDANVRNYTDLEKLYDKQTRGMDKFFDYLTLDFYGKLPRHEDDDEDSK